MEDIYIEACKFQQSWDSIKSMTLQSPQSLAIRFVVRVQVDCRTIDRVLAAQREHTLILICKQIFSADDGTSVSMVVKHKFVIELGWRLSNRSLKHN